MSDACAMYWRKKMQPMLGERGEHARSAVGAGSLPHNMTVEVEAIFRLED